MTKEDIIKLAREAGLVSPMTFYAGYERFAHLVAAAEREECAKVAFDGYDQRLDGDEIGAAIRARGTT
jgi:hypothetical protein